MPADAARIEHFSTSTAPVALVTGASSGLGAEFARLAAADGFRVILTARRRERLDALAEELERQTSRPMLALPLDLSDPDAPDEILSLLSELNVVPEVLVNNAGFGAFGPMVEMDPERTGRMIDLNVRALTELSIRIGREMRDCGCGRILNVASTASYQPCPFMGVYGATKAYVRSFTEALAEELRGTSVTATAFSPGPTATEFGAAAGLAAEGALDLFDLEKAERSAADAARTGWIAMKAGRAVVIDGWVNRLIARVVWATPEPLVRLLAGRLLGRLKTE
ncbi:SDR family NAD(P)-dependent oxidoreductase [Sutterella sp.]|uniref:SDR family NAD(P)-dependent oxidoreductase n=1 Tax=Sutterella sp. TaxID=1981025 RepID=UPI003FD8FC72